MLGITSATAAGVAGAFLAESLIPAQELSSNDAYLSALGENQNGIELPIQNFVNFVSLDVKPDITLESVKGWMTVISDDIDRMTEGKELLADTQPQITTMKSNLTVTVGYGPSLFTKLNIQDRAPENFKELPQFKIDKLLPEYSGGDVLLQVASNSKIHLEYITRSLIRDSNYFSTVRWTQSGFSSVDSESPIGSQRNLMGQIDGTNNPELNTSSFKNSVWADSGPDWFRGGTMLVLRRIQMNLDTWDILEQDEKEKVIGRKLSNGAPLGGDSELDVVDLSAINNAGVSLIPPFAHIARAHSGELNALPIFRRPFNYSDGFSKDGKIDAGLLWTAYCKDAYAQYVPIQKSLEDFDLLNKWTTPVGSALFAIPRGRKSKSEIIGQEIFE